MRRSRSKIAVTLLLATGLLALGGNDFADAAFPGANGRIAFASNQDGSWDVYTTNADGGDQVRLTDDPANETQPSYSADGSKIAFASNRGGNWDVYTMNANGGDVTRLTTDPGVDTQPSFSPDGSKIVFIGKRGASWYGDVYMMNADGSDQIRLIDKGGIEDTPSFSPDGQRIVFGRTEGGYRHIFTMDPSGGSLTALTHGSASDRQPSFSPNGEQIVFSSRREGRFGVFSMRADGGGIVRLGGDSSVMPAYSPDGRLIAFVRNGHVFAMSASGGRETQLTRGRGSQAWPSWQPLVGPLPPSGKGGGGKSERLRFGKPILNRRRGTAKLPVIVPAAGTLRLRGKRVKPLRHSRAVGAAVTVKLPIAPRPAVLRALKRRGSAKVKVLVTYSRRKGAPETRAKTFKLRMRHR